MALFDDQISFWRDRILAGAVHTFLSGAVAALAGLLVFAVWYPFPYGELSGGRDLFFLVVSVDVVMGPLVTLAIFDRRKTWHVLRRDLQVIGLLQLVALGYGLWIVFAARPVHMVFEYDRFRVVHAIEIDRDLLDKAPSQLRALPLWGPTPIGLRPFVSESERMEATVVAIQGVTLGARVDLWIPYDDVRTAILKEAKPITKLLERRDSELPRFESAARKSGLGLQSLLYLPLTGRKLFWTALIDPVTADVVATVPVDPY